MSRRLFTDTALPPGNNIFFYTKEFARWALIDVPKYTFSSSSKELPDPFDDSKYKPEIPDNERNATKTSPYNYVALPDPTDDSKYIRLLELLPGTRQDDIACRLQNEELHNGLMYEALSYVWGDVSETTPVQVDEQTLEIGQNLRYALLDLRRVDRSRFLWADAICIDQDSMHERAKQVGIMGDIYRQATRTLVWLGPSYPFVDLAYECIGILERDARAHQQAIQDGSDIILSTRETSQTKKEQEKMRHGCSVLEELAAVSWWTRAWVVQEVVLASESVVICGQFEACWDSFATAIEYGIGKGKFDIAVAGIFEDDSFEMLRTINELKRRTWDDGRAWQLLELLRILRPRLATDPRDKVFAIMGLLKGDGHAMDVVPDYTTAVADVYCMTAVAVLQGTSSLDILSHCISDDVLRNQQACTPSWVPDWSISETICVPLTHKFPAASRHFQATLGSEAYSQFYVELGVAGFTGQLLDVISECSSLLEVRDDVEAGYEEEDDPSLKRMFVEIGYELRVIHRSLLKVVDYFNTILTWEEVAAREPCHLYGVSDAQPPKKMFWQTLCTGQLDGAGTEDAEGLFNEWRSKLSPISGLRKMKASKFPRLFSNLGLMGYFWTTWNSFGAFSEMIPHARGRRLGKTKSGWLCLLPARVEVGDMLVLLKGGKVPYVVRSRDDGYWSLVGEAYVHGIMKGEAYDEDAGMLMKFK